MNEGEQTEDGQVPRRGGGDGMTWIHSYETLVTTCPEDMPGHEVYTYRRDGLE